MKLIYYIFISVAAIDVQAVEGKSVTLPCDLKPPGHDKVYMVFWFQDDAGIPLYRYVLKRMEIAHSIIIIGTIKDIRFLN